jgi:hypothetical protein
MNTERVTKKPEEFTRKERARIVLGVLCGEMTYDEACEQYGLDRQALEALKEAYLEAIDEPPRSKKHRRQRSPRWLAAAAAMLAVSGSGLWVYASGHNCAGGLICFNAGEPATADDVNQNFKTLRDWLVSKVGPTNNPWLTVGDGSAWGVHVGLRDGDGFFGLRFFDNPAGGSGDTAWVRYRRDGSGEDLSLEIGVANDSNDDITFIQGGQTRLKIESDQVQVHNATLTTSGAATIGGALTTNGSATVNGVHNVNGNLRVRSSPLVDMRRFYLDANNWNRDTGMSTADWNCIIGGINFFNGDIYETGVGNPMQMWTYPHAPTGTWWVFADFRTHNTHDQKWVGVVCFRTEISSRQSWWTDISNN